MPDSLTPLKKLRISRGLSQAAVANAIGLEQPTYSRIENGFGCLAQNAEKIAKHLGCAITEEMILYPDRYTDYEVGQR